MFSTDVQCVCVCVCYEGGGHFPEQAHVCVSTPRQCWYARNAAYTSPVFILSLGTTSCSSAGKHGVQSYNIIVYKHTHTKGDVRTHTHTHHTHHSVPQTTPLSFFMTFLSTSDPDGSDWEGSELFLCLQFHWSGTSVSPDARSLCSVFPMTVS